MSEEDLKVKALEMALTLNASTGSGATADGIVADAKKFYDFLTRSTTA